MLWDDDMLVILDFSLHGGDVIWKPVHHALFDLAFFVNFGQHDSCLQSFLAF